MKLDSIEIQAIEMNGAAVRIPESENPLYDMMCSGKADGFQIGQAVQQLNDQRETAIDAVGDTVLSDENPMEILRSGTKDFVELVAVKRNDGDQPETHARIRLNRDENGAWSIESFVIPLDLDDTDHGYSDIAGAVKQHFKQNDQKFACDFLKVIADGGRTSDAFMRASNGMDDEIIAQARAELPTNDQGQRTALAVPQIARSQTRPGQFERALSNARISNAPNPNRAP